MEPSEVVKLLEGIGETLSPYAERAWAIAMRQQGIVATQMWIGAGVFGLLALLGLGLLLYTFWESGGGYGSEVGGGLGVFLMLAGLMICVPLALGAWGRGANPEYYAIMALKGMIP